MTADTTADAQQDKRRVLRFSSPGQHTTGLCRLESLRALADEGQEETPGPAACQGAAV